MLLTADEIRAAGKIEATYDTLWKDVQRVANRVHVTNGNERAWAWHHLLLVANFKTRATLFPPVLLPAPETMSLRRKDVPLIAGAIGTLRLRAEDPATWPRLSQLKGLREPAGNPGQTTVLSVLWPGRHVIMDWRALSAALALAGARLGWGSSAAEPGSTRRAAASWGSYSWYRDTVLEAASQVGERPLLWNGSFGGLGARLPGQLRQSTQTKLRSTNSWRINS
jgi:hypothetical protein